MNPFEKVLFAFLATAAKEAPVFVHSAHGSMILNAGEDLLGNLLLAFQKPTNKPPPASSETP